MNLLKIAVAPCYWPDEEQLLGRELERVAPGRVELRVARSKSELLELLGDSEVFYGDRLTAAHLGAAPVLAWAHLNVAGVERSLTPQLAARGVVLTNSRAMHRVHVAEHVLGLMLAFAKRNHIALRRQLERVWAQAEIVSTSFSLRGLTCGVLGLGGIGLEVARLAHAFGMRCIATRRRPDAGAASFVERVFGEDGLQAVLLESDFLVICLPLTAKTRGLIGARELALMKPGAHLVNIARGAIVDEDALLAALGSGRLAGAGLDVTQREPLPADSPLWTAENVLLTPHVSGNYPGYAVDAARVFADNVARYLAGQPLENVVDQSEGY
ncbi:MAG: D-2-hydroxyacid dehydrogenase [Candidatus Wallbacteria bacterium]|nr:D-2-hydroxyacid dehydrogenase [Candidatus Wallbacteria bacterium]